MATTYTSNYNLGKQEDKNDNFSMDVITENMDKIDAALSSHELDTDNPHGVTKAQIGLDNVVNVDTTTTANITDSTDKRFITDVQKTVLENTSGSNTGDETTSTIQSKLGVSSTTTDGYLTKEDFTTFNNKANIEEVTPISHVTDTSNPHSVTKAQVGLGNVDNTSDLDKPISTLTQTALNLKASTTTLTTHTGNADIHVTAEDKTAWNGKVKSVSSIEAPATTTTFRGLIATTTNNNVTIYDGRSLVCSGMSSGIGWYRIFKISPTHKNQIDFMVALHKTPQSFESETCKLQITFVYNTNPKILCLAKSTNNLTYPKIRIVKSNENLAEAYIEVYNSNVANNHYLTAFVTGYTSGNGTMSSVDFTTGEIPDGYTAYEYDIANSGVVSYTAVPETLTSTGTAGEIAYDTSYMYICTATNTWKKILLGTAHEDNTDIHVTAEDKTAWNGKVSYTAVPASATATGTKGDIAYDSGYMYVCTDTNTWKRTALTTW